MGGPGIDDCFALLRRLELPALDTLEMLRRVVFNFLVGNWDAHGKNFSVLYRNGRCGLAPLYDVMSTTIYLEVSCRMAMKIDGEYAFKWISRGKFLRMGGKLGFGEHLVAQTLDRFSKHIQRECARLRKDCERRHPCRIYQEIEAGIVQRVAQIREKE